MVLAWQWILHKPTLAGEMINLGIYGSTIKWIGVNWRTTFRTTTNYIHIITYLSGTSLP